jgi:hypothetical protein
VEKAEILSHTKELSKAIFSKLSKAPERSLSDVPRREHENRREEEKPQNGLNITLKKFDDVISCRCTQHVLRNDNSIGTSKQND